jgi:Cell division protein ZapA
MSAKQMEVQIMGQSYLLGCPEGGEAKLQAAVGKVDVAMCKIRDAGKIKARDRVKPPPRPQRKWLPLEAMPPTKSVWHSCSAAWTRPSSKTVSCSERPCASACLRLQ